MFTPGYKSGFAPRDYIPAYPELWDGCVGAWAPLLGPSGSTLYDWGGKKFDGTLTNLTVANAWVTNSGYNALRFDGTGYVTTANSANFGLQDGKAMSISMWFYPTSVASTQTLIHKHISYTPDQGTYTMTVRISFSSAGALTFHVGSPTLLQWNTWATGSSVISSNNLYHLVVTFHYTNNQGSDCVLYLNGVPRTVTSSTNGNAYSGYFVQEFPSQFLLGARLTSTITEVFAGDIFDAMVFRRRLDPTEVNLLWSKRGIAYEIKPAITYRPDTVGTQQTYNEVAAGGIRISGTSQVSNIYSSSASGASGGIEVAGSASTNEEIPHLMVTLIDGETEEVLFEDNTLDPIGIFQKSTDGGVTWTPWNRTDKQNEETYIRYVYRPGKFAINNRKVRTVLSIYQ